VGTVTEGTTVTPHSIVTSVTDLYKVIDGVPTEVVYEQDFSAGQLEESELFFVAQDDNGTSWLFGEYPEAYSNGHLQGAPNTWFAGVIDGREGVFMLAAPRVGTPSYSEGISLSQGFDDCAIVYQNGQSICVPLGCYDNVLVTDEWSPLAPLDGHQRKYYAPGVGGIHAQPASGTLSLETVSLVSLVHLSPPALAALREGALQQDMRGYRISKMYQQTPPAVPR
jgi:hypothetical protein